MTDRNVQYVVRRGALFVDPEWARIMGREDLRLAHAEGVMRTVAALVRDGVVKC